MKREKILVSGSRGGLASEFSRTLCDEYDFVGIDPRKPKKERMFYGENHRTHYRSRKVDDLFRQNKFRAFFHLGRISAGSGMDRSDRYSENVLGTQHILELCRQYEVPLVVALSTFHVYGAHPQNPLYMKENDPLRATQTIPELSDALELDHLTTQFALSSKAQTVVLRPAHIVGPSISNTLAKILRMSWVPTPLGFDPLFQVIHQDDMLDVLKLILKTPTRGIFNLAGPDILPLSEVLRMKGINRAPLPHSLIRSFLHLNALTHLNIPYYMIEFFKYSCIIDPAHFIETFKFKYKHSLVDSLSNL